MPSPRRILVIRPSALGDVCRSVPVLASLRRAYPDAIIDWLVQDSFAEAIAHHPALSSAVLFPRHELGKLTAAGRILPALNWMRRLRHGLYDLALDCQGLARSGLFAWATGAPRRVGYANARELGWLGVNERHDVPRTMHSVDRMLELIRRAGVEPIADMRLYTSPQEREAIQNDERLREPYVLMAPTSRWVAKQWPAARFASVARALLDRGVRVVLVGSAGERPQIAPLTKLGLQDARVIDLVGTTSIARLMALVERSALVIANDSAVLHMAVGFDRPLVALYGPTRIDRVGPYRREQDVIQHVAAGEKFSHKDPSSAHLMERIGVDEVIIAATQKLEQAPTV